MQKEKDTEIAKKRSSQSKKIIVALSIICVLAIGSGVFFYLKYSRIHSAANEKQRQLDYVGRIIELPQEAPALVTVADKNRLENKLLAGKVENGDSLMIFSKAQRLIIYRPSSQKVIDMLTLTAQDTPALPQQ